MPTPSGAGCPSIRGFPNGDDFRGLRGAGLAAGLRPRRADGSDRGPDYEVREVAAEEVAVAGQESLRLDGGVSADQEVGRYPLSATAGEAIGAEGIRGDECRVTVERRERDAERVEQTGDRVAAGEPGGDLCPDDLAGDDASLLDAGAHRLLRGFAVLGIGPEDVDQDVAVNGGDQVASSSPRSSAITSSVLLSSGSAP